MATDENTPQRPDPPPPNAPYGPDTDWRELLTEAAVELERAVERVRPKRELRDDRILMAVVDGGHSRETVAEWAGVSRSHVNDVLGNPTIRARVLRGQTTP